MLMVGHTNKGRLLDDQFSANSVVWTRVQSLDERLNFGPQTNVGHLDLMDSEMDSEMVG